MLSRLLTAWCLMALCVAIHAMGLTAVFRWMRVHSGRGKRRYWSATLMLVSVAGWALLLHLLQIVVWAIFYVWNRAMPDFATAAYFSAVTYTTTGYGDLVLSEEWRLAGGVEALTGILMCGLSTGLFFAVFTDVFGLHQRSTPASRDDENAKE